MRNLAVSVGLNAINFQPQKIKFPCLTHIQVMDSVPNFQPRNMLNCLPATSHFSNKRVLAAYKNSACVRLLAHSALATSKAKTNALALVLQAANQRFTNSFGMEFASGSSSFLYVTYRFKRSFAWHKMQQLT